MPRATNQSKMAHIRLEEPIMNALRERAKACGMSVAELHRFALRRVLGMIDGTPIDYTEADAARLTILAAGGDLFAARTLTQRYIEMALQFDGFGEKQLASESLMAAIAHGEYARAMGGRADERELARIYLIRARIAREAGQSEDAHILQAHALSALDRMADAGDAIAEEYINLAPATTPEAFKAARDMRERPK